MISLTPHQQKALNYKNHTSLTANAGSGKTFVLSKRYLEIALNESISLRNIAAITFTDKAAGELYKKIADQIEEKISSETDEKIQKKLEGLRRQLVSANISTIHSFCIDILREYPVEAGIDANFVPVEEQRSNELIELSIEEIIRKSLHKKEDEQRLKYLIRIISSKKLFAEQLKSLIKNRKNVLSLYDNIYKYPEEETARSFYLKFIELSKTVLFGSSVQEKKSEIVSAAARINDFVLGEKPANETALKISKILTALNLEHGYEKLLNLFHMLKSEMCTQNLHIKKTGYLNCGRDEDRELLEKFFHDLNYFTIEPDHSEIENELAHFGTELIYFFNKTLELYELKKRENSYLDFEDILLKSFELLKKPDIRAALSEKFKYIMIDEYQDTNEVQYQIFLPILDFLKRGNLFVVGDEKQSIYMFRDAELEVFFQTKNEIASAGGKENILSLPESFRMAPNLCAFTNYLFRNLFNNSLNENPLSRLFNEVDHSDLVCAREDGFNGEVEILLSDKNDEAELCARRILNLTNEKISGSKIDWNDIAILTRKRKNFSELEKAFIKYKIPFSVVGGKGFYQKQTVYDIFNYFSFLLSTGNDTALTGILRSPFFSISDTEIFEISLEPGDSFWQKLRKYPGKNKNFDYAVKLISENLALVNNIAIPSLLRKILKETDILAVLAAKPDGIQELANVEKLIQLTIKFTSQGFTTLYDYINFLKESIEKMDDEAQAPLSDDSGLPGETGSVKIMTLHQAKGLEFPVVFLFKSDESSKSSTIKAKDVFVDKHLGLLSKLPINENYFSEYRSAPIIGASNFIALKKDLAELKRLFYVGVTRAKSYLFISAAEKKSYPKDSFMGLISNVFDIRLNTTEIQLRDTLKFLRKQNEEYSNINDDISLVIPIKKYITESPSVTKEETGTNLINKITIDEILDKSEKEIISATKISVYKQCPLKYQLTYEYGLTPLINKYKLWHKENRGSNFEFPAKENSDEEIGKDENLKDIGENRGVLKGKIIHKILQNELSLDLIEQFTENELKRETGFLKDNGNSFSELKKEITGDLFNFYSSEVYRGLKEKKDFRNEFEIYINESNYFLYGIIDKLIFDLDKIIIVDYKTDDISQNEIKERMQTYINQLKFYSYIVSKLFPGFEFFELKLIFIRYPDEPASRVFSKKDILFFGNEIENTINEIRNKEFPKNLNHCKKCYFAVKNSCIKD